MPHTNYVATIAFRPDGKVFAAGDYHGLVRLRDSGTGREVASPLPQGAIPAAMAYSPDGRLLAVGLHRTGTRLWDAVTHQPFGQPLSHDVSHTHVEFRPDSRVLVAGDEVRSRLWDVVTCQPVGEPIVDEAIGGFLPDGRTLLTLGRDGGLRLRDSGTAALVRRVLTVPAPATCAAFRGRGDLIAVGCEDGTVRLCDPVAAQAVGPPRLMRHPVLRVAFSADGRTVVAVDEVGETGAWPVPEPADEASLDDLTLRIEARTGLRLEQGRSISRLDYPEWRERLDRLDQIDPSAARPADDASWHEPMIREAEQLGNAFAAAWHLDRLIAARPGDWLLYARRGRARTALDQYDEAAADFRQAERLGSRDSVLDFQAHRLVDCTVARRWDEALWYADRLVAARPDDWALREDRAAIYAALGRDVDRLADLVQAVDLGADRSLVLPLAEQSARAGRWAEAAAWLERCRQGQPTDNALAQAEAVLMLRAHDLAGYRAVRAAVVARHGAGWFIFVDLVSDAEILALGVGDPGDDRKVLHWLSRVIAANSSPPIVPGVGFSVMGAMLVRGGRLDEAIVRLGQAEEIAQRARLADYSLRWAYLALAHARKGNSAEARRWLARLSRWTATARISYWEEQKIALVREEAETALLDAVFPRDPFTNPRP